MDKESIEASSYLLDEFDRIWNGAKYTQRVVEEQIQAPRPPFSSDRRPVCLICWVVVDYILPVEDHCCVIEVDDDLFFSHSILVRNEKKRRNIPNIECFGECEVSKSIRLYGYTPQGLEPCHDVP